MKFITIFVTISLFFFARGKPVLTSTYVIKNGEMTKFESESDNIELEEPVPINLDDIPSKTSPYNVTKDGLLQGSCEVKLRQPLIYSENFILESDSKSQIAAAMEISVDKNYVITCVEVLDRSNGTDHAKILRGGIGSHFVEVAVSPGYGKGFDFTVKLYGYYLHKENGV